MAGKPNKEFGTRRPVTVQPAAPTKRSRHVALLLTGTLAIGGGAYALMPSENCDPNRPGMAAPGPMQSSAGCSARGSSSGGGHGSSGSSSRSSFFSGDSASGGSSKGVSSSDAGSGSVTRGGFGAFAHAFTSHFSGGG
jgi:hypothetical protein